MHRSEAEGTRERSDAPEGAARRCAGFPSPAEQYLEPPLDLNELLVKRPAATFFVRVEGDSMINAGIHDKDLLVVDRSLTPSNGDIIIASVDTVKRDPRTPHKRTRVITNSKSLSFNRRQWYNIRYEQFVQK